MLWTPDRPRKASECNGDLVENRHCDIEDATFYIGSGHEQHLAVTYARTHAHTL
jgi:hypothetical protein